MTDADMALRQCEHREDVRHASLPDATRICAAADYMSVHVLVGA